jgi:hypothetical protein
MQLFLGTAVSSVNHSQPCKIGTFPRLLDRMAESPGDSQTHEEADLESA